MEKIERYYKERAIVRNDNKLSGGALIEVLDHIQNAHRPNKSVSMELCQWIAVGNRKENYKMLSNECCNGCACHNWIKAMGYDPDDSYPDDVCHKCGAEGPYYLFNQAQEYGWGGGAKTMDSLRRLREEKEDVIEHLFQYIVQRLKSKINFSGIVASFEERLGSNEKAIAVADSMLTLAASGLECYESDEDAKAYYDQATEGKVPLSVEAFSQFRQLIADEMAIWFEVRGLLLIGEPDEEVERILTSKLEEL